MVKPNREELARTVGRDLLDEPDVIEAARSLTDRGVTWVVVSHGKAGVAIVSAEAAYRCQPPVVDPIVNPIGSGDSLAAALAWAIDDGKEFLEAMRLAVGAASHNVGQLLPATLSAGEVRRLADQVTIERV